VAELKKKTDDTIDNIIRIIRRNEPDFAKKILTYAILLEKAKLSK
jgi:hypothetical protein